MKYGAIGRFSTYGGERWTFMVVRSAVPSDFDPLPLPDADVSGYVAGVIIFGHTIYGAYVSFGDIGPIVLGDDIEWLD